MLQELREQVTDTVGAGLDLTGQLIRSGVPLAQSALEQAPRVINTARSALDVINEPENRERVSQITGVGTRVAAGASRVASGAPELVSQGTRLAGSIIKAANDTAPLIVNGIQEFTDQIPLITGFASAYAEVNAEQTQEVIHFLLLLWFFLLSLTCVMLTFRYLLDYLIILQVVNTFYTSLQCDLQCKDLVDTDLKAECEIQFCKKVDEDEDEYDYGDI